MQIFEMLMTLRSVLYSAPDCSRSKIKAAANTSHRFMDVTEILIRLLRNLKRFVAVLKGTHFFQKIQSL
jgi:hypothetical protein